jgi:filamin
VAKSKQVGPVLPLFKSDASKVTSKGMGLKKAYLQKQNMFTVHAGDAGKLTSTYYMYFLPVL